MLDNVIAASFWRYDAATCWKPAVQLCMLRCINRSKLGAHRFSFVRCILIFQNPLNSVGQYLKSFANA